MVYGIEIEDCRPESEMTPGVERAIRELGHAIRRELWAAGTVPGATDVRDKPEPMHERSLIQALLAEVEQLMSERAASRVRKITVSIGDRKQRFNGQGLQRAFDELAASTAASGAELEIRRVPVEAHCESCNYDFVVERSQYVCPKCGQMQVCVTRGEELVLENLVLE